MRLIIKYLFFVLVLLSNCILLAQNSSNPFELKHRQSIIETTKKEQVTKTRTLKTKNPFDVLEQPLSPISAPTNTSPKTGVTKEIITDSSKNYLFWTFFFILLFFTTVVSISRKKLEQSYRAFLNDNYSRQLHRVNQGSFSLSYFLLYLLFFLNAGVFVFLAANDFGGNLPRNFACLSTICLGVGLVFIIKHLLLAFVSNIFPISKEIELYSFTIMIFSIILGIVLLPINILIAFAPNALSKLTIWLGLGAVLATYSFRSLRGLSIGSKYWILHSFHFLLYLCAVEILPVVVLLKFVLLRIN